ncbi:MAG: hypothetical protein A3C07_04190 [Candidatus Sungbacteria bacterium RIFCSPHIGHO2_02_FULL_47_11]|uniref:DUF5666 domain-containing protein n=1 Tax=Candidatus Sungbacteria bacterium RIFCSPHIGHO2_02_FULL_47_11 TaxID=1802270 RepID=A0A1G2KL94_9BACT|nr:MAG: hypothetical protein A3C07_04190 [Candidatus Sungbacteria bacterium RIFCSPHIGHO2_02_FULL_47_11]
MKKTFAGLLGGVVAFILLVGAANGQACREAALKENIYGGIVGTVSGVATKPVVGKEAILQGEGIRYDFVVTFWGGKTLKSYSVFPRGETRAIKNGDAFAYVRSPDSVRKAYNWEERFNPVVFSGSKCEIVGLDFSMSIREIPL